MAETQTSNPKTEIEPIKKNKAWFEYKKQFLIFSSAAKPIYVKYGNEQEVIGIVGVLTALIATTLQSNDKIKAIIAGPLKIVFKTYGHLWLVCVTRTDEPIVALERQLNMYHNQVLSILTKKVLQVLEDKPQFDARNQLMGTMKHLDNLFEAVNSDPSYFLDCSFCLKVPYYVRTQIGNILNQNLPEDIFHSIIIANDKVVQLARPKKHKLSPADIHILINFVKSTDSFKESEASVCPVCLPHFNASGFFYANIWYLNENVVLILLSAKMGNFSAYAECKEKIQEQLIATESLTVLNEVIQKRGYTMADVNIPGLQHFLYRSLSRNQLSAPAFSNPYHTRKQQRRLLRLYENAYHRIYMSTEPIINYMCVADKEIVFVWTNTKQNIQLFAAFSPLLNKEQCFGLVKQLLDWTKQQEENLFIGEALW